MNTPHSAGSTPPPEGPEGSEVSEAPTAPRNPGRPKESEQEQPNIAPDTIAPDTVQRIASLAQIAITETEAQGFAADFERILKAFATLSEVDVSGVAPLTHPSEISASLRADTRVLSLPRELLLSSAPDAREGFYAVPKTIRAVASPSKDGAQAEGRAEP